MVGRRDHLDEGVDVIVGRPVDSTRERGAAEAAARLVLRSARRLRVASRQHELLLLVLVDIWLLVGNEVITRDDTQIF